MILAKKSLHQWLSERLQNHYNLPSSYISDDVSFEQLGLSSIQFMEIIEQVEAKTKIEIPDSSLDPSMTIAGLVNMVLDHYHFSKDTLAEDISIAGSDSDDDLSFAEIMDARLSEFNPTKLPFMRKIISTMDRTVTVADDEGKSKELIMFGSNNYLGLANNENIIKAVKECISKTGVGVAGPPLLNGYSDHHSALEQKLALHKKTQSAMLLGSGYSANLGLAALIGESPSTLIVFDELSHASFLDGLKMAKCAQLSFSHNNMSSLRNILRSNHGKFKNIFIAFEGIYSMDGDIARLDEISNIANNYGAYMVVDEAHSTGVLGNSGSGLFEHFDMLPNDKTIIMGTFSKVLAVSGAFICATKKIIDYFRYHLRAYIFSASLPFSTVAAVEAGLSLLSSSKLRGKLRDNMEYFFARLAESEIFPIYQESPIVSILKPDCIDALDACKIFSDAGLFISPIIYPAVPANKERFRISISANHTKLDIDRLIGGLNLVYK